MKKSTKIILSIVGVGVIGGVAYILIRKFRKQNEFTPPTLPVNTNPPSYYPPSNSGGGRNDDFPLTQGSSGPRVQAVQRWLNDTVLWDGTGSTGFTGCNPKLDVDGNWGPLTDACFKKMRNPSDSKQDDTIGTSYFKKWIADKGYVY